MPKARVYELAKELGVDSKTVLNKLEAMGEFVKSASSTVEPPVARKLRNAFASNAQGNASESKKPAVPAKKPAAPAASPTPAPRATPAAPAASAAKLALPAGNAAFAEPHFRRRFSGTVLSAAGRLSLCPAGSRIGNRIAGNSSDLCGYDQHSVFLL